MAQVIYPREKEIVGTSGSAVETTASVVTDAAGTARLIEAAGGETTICCYTGSIIGGGLTMVAETTFTAKSGYCYKPTPTVTMHNLIQGGYDYTNYYSAKIVPTFTDNRITSFKAQVFYDPPEDKFLFPDPNLFSSFDHLAFVDYEIKLAEDALTNTITHVSYKENLTRYNQETMVVVYGNVGTKYNIRIPEFSWFQNDWTVTNNFYDFKLNTFAALNADSINTGTIGSDGKNIHYIKIPYYKTNAGSHVFNSRRGKRYDIVLNNYAGSTIHSNAPSVNGDASIIQYGLQQLNIETASYTSTMTAKEDAIQLPKAVPGVKTPITIKKPVFFKAGNSDTSNTVVTLNDEHLDLKEGMRMFNIGSTSGNTITVSKIQGKKLTTSTAIAVPDNTEVRFEENVDLHDVTLTVYPSGGKTLYITRQPTVDDIGGFKNTVVLANGAVNASTTVILDSTAGIVPGMIVTGEGILDTTTIYVSSITNATTLVVNKAITVADDTRLTFTGVNNNIEVIDIQADVFDGGVRIKSTLKVNEINDVFIGETLQADAKGLIYVDNFLVAK